ncbi:hypothetical protein MCUN1_000328 [Malassezia cuniculi]|uniref:Importin N-terminal domain-containing protein n=1 Tax=Malassezia cuniculi TaxID=948313 RepID=A0AAF0ER49_9BASI|nr:hypothetical protein MCUN1_000328 [Malassezia cuniculi]
MDISQRLRDTLSSVHATRARAEDDLSRAALPRNDPQGAFGVQLAQIFASDAPLAERQAAGTALKRYIRERWSVAFETFLKNAAAAGETGGEALPLEAKQSIRVTLLGALASPERKVRLLAAQLLALVSTAEFPDNFPELLPTVHSLLENGSPDGVHGALVFFADLVQEELDENQLLLVARDYVPLLHRVLTDGKYAPHVHARCLLVFRQCLISLFTVRETYSDTVRGAIDTHLPLWLNTVGTMLDPSIYSTADWTTASTWEVLGLRREITRVLGAAQQFRAAFAPYSEPLLTAALANLEQLVPLFTATEISGTLDAPSPPDGDSDIASDAAGLGMSLLSFFGDTVRAPFMRSFLVQGGVGGSGDATLALGKLVRMAQAYAQMSLAEEAEWSEDADAFVAEDDEENMAVTLRTAAMDLSDALLNEYPSPTLQAFSAALRAVSMETNWRETEALLLLLGATHASIEEILDEGTGAEALNVQQILALCAAGINQSHSFLRGRCFVCASQFAASVNDTTASEFLRLALETTKAEFEVAPLHVKLAAVRALRNFGNILPDATAEYTAEIVIQLGPLLGRARGATLVLIVDTIDAAIHNSVEAKHLEPPVYGELAMAALSAWRANLPDPQVEMSLAALLETMASSKVEQVAAQTVRLAVDASFAVLGDPMLALSAAALLRAVVDAAPAHALAVEPLFPSGLEYIFAAEDAEAVQHVLHCITVLLQKQPQATLQWRGGTESLQAILRVVEHLLAPTADPEMCSMPLGTLLVTLFISAADHLSPVMPALVNVLAQRVAESTNPACSAAMLYPLAFLFAEHADAVLQLLADAPDTLAGVASRWAEELGHVHGTFLVNVHILGVAQLLDRWPAALEAQVDGDPLPMPDGIIITRSKARETPQYSRIAAGAKMLKELIGIYEQAESNGDRGDRTSAAVAAAAAAGAEYDDEWCDEEPRRRE